MITLMPLCDFLEKKFNHRYDKDYVSKIVRKIDRELVVNVDRIKVNEELATLGERVRMARESLIRTATGQIDESGFRPAYRDKTAAWGKLLAWEKMFIDVKRQLGVFNAEVDNPIKDAAYREISDDERSRMVTAFRSLGISLPEPRQIEAVATVKPVVDIITNEPTKQPTTEPSEPKPAVFDPLAAKKLAAERKVNVQPATGVAIA